MQQHLEMIKGFGASAVGFAAWAISFADVDKWVSFGAGVGGFLLVWLTVIKTIKNWNRPPKGDE